MKRMFNGFTAVCLGLLMALPQGRISAQSLPKLRQGMTYEQARNLLLNQGWQAIYNTRQVNNPDRFSTVDYLISILGYTEVIDCSGTGLGLCVLQFQNATGQTLNITTANNIPGEQPTVFGWEISGREKPTNDGIVASDCQSTVVRIKQHLMKGRKLQVIVEKRSLVERYPDYPDGRPDWYILGFQGPAARSMMASQQLVLYSARQIVEACSSVGLVTFSLWGSGEAHYIGLLPNGQVDHFTCIDFPGRGAPSERWGQYYCSL